jgi:hypothetical protein
LLDNAATGDVFVNDSAAIQKLLNASLLIVAVMFCSVAVFIFEAAVVIFPPNINRWVAYKVHVMLLKNLSVYRNFKCTTFMSLISAGFTATSYG